MGNFSIISGGASGGSGGGSSPVVQGDWTTGTDTPDNTVGADGDLYYQSTNGFVYQRISGVYVHVSTVVFPTNADQTCGFNRTPTTGTYTVFGQGVAYNASLADFQTALINGIGFGNIYIASFSATGFRLQWVGNYAGTPISQITVDTTGLDESNNSITGSDSTNGVTQVIGVAIVGDSTSGGTCSLVLGASSGNSGLTIAGIPCDGTDPTSAFAPYGSYSGGSFTPSDGNWYTSATITSFTGDGTIPSTSINTDGTQHVQSISLNASQTKGSFTVNGVSVNAPFTASSVQSAFNSIGDSPHSPPTVTGATGGPFTITYPSKRLQSSLSVDGSLLVVETKNTVTVNNAGNAKSFAII